MSLGCGAGSLGFFRTVHQSSASNLPTPPAFPSAEEASEEPVAQTARDDEPATDLSPLLQRLNAAPDQMTAPEQDEVEEETQATAGEWQRHLRYSAIMQPKC